MGPDNSLFVGHCLGEGIEMGETRQFHQAEPFAESVEHPGLGERFAGFEKKTDISRIRIRSRRTRNLRVGEFHDISILPAYQGITSVPLPVHPHQQFLALPSRRDHMHFPNPSAVPSGTVIFLEEPFISPVQSLRNQLDISHR